MTRGMSWGIARGMSRGLILPLLFVLAVSGTACAGMVSLGYDDGQAEDGIWINDHRGHGVVFTAPSDNWVLSQVAICGMLVPGNGSEMFTIEVWDENLTLISRTVERATSYFNDNLTWAEVDIPDVKVSGDFMVSFYEFAGVYVGTDLTIPYGQSAVTARNPNRILPWDVQNHAWNETNWMIGAIGYSPAPTFGIKVRSDKVTLSIPAKIDVAVQDADGNLMSAAMYIVDNKTGEIVWSEAKELNGGSGDVSFSWPGMMFQIAVNDEPMGPVYVINAAGIAESLNDLLAYSAPAVLELDMNRTGSVMAYFGSDGRLNALIDTYGGVHYLSQDVLNRTDPGIDYGKYAKGNITIIENSSRIWLLTVGIPTSSEDSGTTVIGPVVLSGSPTQNYGLKLQKVKAGMGEYLLLLEAQDSAFNAVRGVGEKTIKVV